MKGQGISQACSDDRAARVRQGTLSSSEWQEYTAHLATCADCRVTSQVIIDFEQSAAPAAGDERILERAAKQALAGARGRRGHAFRAGAAAAAILLVAGAASGAILLRAHYVAVAAKRSDPGGHRGGKPGGYPGGTKARNAGPPAGAPETSASLPTPDPVAPATAAEAPRPARTVSKTTKRRTGRLASIAHDDVQLPMVEDASTLFARAVVEREQGRTSVALATFRSLQSRFPQTPQAVLSLVSLADLALDRGEAAAALAAFEQYLAIAPSGTLVPEGLVGKARALSALGRTTEADAVWREIARRYPDSPYAERTTGTRSDSP